MLLLPSAIVIVPVPLATAAVLVTMPGDGVAQASSSRAVPPQPGAKRGWNSCSNESASEVGYPLWDNSSNIALDGLTADTNIFPVLGYLGAAEESSC